MLNNLFEEFVGLSEAELDEQIRLAEAENRAAAARSAALLAVATARQIHLADGHHSIKGYLRATCNWSNTEVTRSRRLATVIEAIPAVGEALLASRIGIPQALELAKAHANRRVGHLVAEIAQVLLEHAEHLPFDDFKTCVDRFVMLADLDGAFNDLTANLEHRTALVTEVGGSVDISAHGGSPLTATKMITIFERFVQAEFHKDVEARRAEHGEQADQFPLPRSAAQRQFDALEAIFDAAATAGNDGQIADPVVNVVVDDRTADEAFTRAGILLPNGNRLDTDQLAAAVPLDALITETVDDPASLLQRRCETTTGIPVHPALMLQAALTGQVRRVVLDSDGVVIDLGRKRRLFTGSARVAAKLLARRCSHPGCNVAATFSDVDHLDEWARDHGATDQRNADIQCGRHDRFKHRKRWRTRRSTTGRIYSIRSNGTIVLPVGERPPDLSVDEAQRITRARLAALTS